MIPDYHTHTTLCKHAQGAAGEYYAAALARHCTALAFTDHAPAPDGYDPRHRMTMAQYPDYLTLIRSIPAQAGTDILLGLEADYYEHGIPFLSEWLPRQPLDLVLGSIHYLGNWGFDNPAERVVWDRTDVSQAWREYFRLVGVMAETGLFDIVGHLDLPKKFGHWPAEREIREMAVPALDRIAAAGMTIEINTAGLRKPVGEIYPSPLLLSLARARDIPICFGSDAHRPEEVGHAFAAALPLARAAGYTHSAHYRQRRRTLLPLPD